MKGSALDRGRGERAAALLDAGRHHKRLELGEGEASAVAPGEKPPRRTGVGAASMGVSDLGRKVVEEAARRPLAGLGDEGGEHEAAWTADRPAKGR
ncbi:MAG TPA: hypothetical protein VHQ90_09940 [Thermoanaerobaculia bacterium]|nr:hypothetical protein [Thermoanaerobaculia bacterium]